MSELRLGYWFFLLGLIGAGSAGLVPQAQLPLMTLVFIALGVVCGVLLLFEDEMIPVLIVCDSLLVAAFASKEFVHLGGGLIWVFQNVFAFVLPVAILASLKVVFVLGLGTKKGGAG